ncbi:hypothetical protein CDN97_09260 [Pantoea sp. AMG 501]|nr:hypothetical protein CDN97_09260 [Pantoea sp. AMG 501]
MSSPRQRPTRWRVIVWLVSPCHYPPSTRLYFILAACASARQRPTRWRVIVWLVSPCHYPPSTRLYFNFAACASARQRPVLGIALSPVSFAVRLRKGCGRHYLALRSSGISLSYAERLRLSR